MNTLQTKLFWSAFLAGGLAVCLITALLGRIAIGKIEAQLGACTAYVLRAEQENEAFYASLGYVPCGVWRSGILE